MPPVLPPLPPCLVSRLKEWGAPLGAHGLELQEAKEWRRRGPSWWLLRLEHSPSGFLPLVVTSALLVVTSALLVVTRSY